MIKNGYQDKILMCALNTEAPSTEQKPVPVHIYIYIYIYNTDPCFVVAYVLYKLLFNFWISLQLLRNILWVWFPPIKLLDGGKNPTFQEKFVLPLIEGLRELNVVVWNSHTLTPDEFIGSGR